MTERIDPLVEIVRRQESLRRRGEESEREQQESKPESRGERNHLRRISVTLPVDMAKRLHTLAIQKEVTRDWLIKVMLGYVLSHEEILDDLIED